MSDNDVMKRRVCFECALLQSLNGKKNSRRFFHSKVKRKRFFPPGSKKGTNYASRTCVSALEYNIRIFSIKR